MGELTALDAARIVDDARTWDLSIRQRVEGITWMIWGIVASGAFLTYGLAEDAPRWIRATLWAPWVLAGNLATITLWRTLALARPSAYRPDLKHVVILVGLFAAVFAITTFVIQPDRWIVPMIVAGLVWTLLGHVIPGMTRPGVRAGVTIGLGTTATALALAFAGLDPNLAAVTAAALVGAIPVVGGFVLALRG